MGRAFFVVNRLSTARFTMERMASQAVASWPGGREGVKAISFKFLPVGRFVPKIQNLGLELPRLGDLGEKNEI